MTLAALLTKRLAELDMSQAELQRRLAAKDIKVSPVAVNYWCTGQNGIDKDHVPAVAEVLEISRLDLYEAPVREPSESAA